MKRTDINPLPPNFAKYINLVADVELEQAFDESVRQLNEMDKSLFGEAQRQKIRAGQMDGQRHSSTPGRFRQNYVLSGSDGGAKRRKCDAGL
ncbi:MAG TPA: hypothetical protein VGJ66_08035 [Pyrinomonadaceae bacterium]|jgi:hypothetical protein